VHSDGTRGEDDDLQQRVLTSPPERFEAALEARPADVPTIRRCATIAVASFQLR
jgi:hypothetical protein